MNYLVKKEKEKFSDIYNIFITYSHNKIVLTGYHKLFLISYQRLLTEFNIIKIKEMTINDKNIIDNTPTNDTTNVKTSSWFWW